MKARSKLLIGVLLLSAQTVWGIGGQINASDPHLLRLVAGTPVTPALSGLQVSLMTQGVPDDSFVVGVAQRSATGTTPLQRHHKIRVASVSKLFVALGVMRLVESGDISLDTDISEYLGWSLRNPAFPDSTITLRQLLSHTSSIRDGQRYFIAAGEGDISQFFSPNTPYWDDGVHFAIEANQAPGAYFQYANLNFGVIAAAIERVSGQRFDQYMAGRVLIPLGISARFDACAVPPDSLAAGFRKRAPEGEWDSSGPWVAQVDNGDPICFYGMQALSDPQRFLETYVLGSNSTLYSPQGGLRASADDLLVALQLLARADLDGEPRLLSEGTIADMLAPQWQLSLNGANGNTSGEDAPDGASKGLMTAYGLSVHRIDLRTWGIDDGPQELLGHLGNAYGVLSMALFDPVSGDGIAAIITGVAYDPAESPRGTTPLYRVEEELLRWWLDRRQLLTKKPM